MINIKILTKDTEKIGMEISGHSNYDEYGRDIICAGVSVLSQNTLLSILNLTKAEIDYEIDEGYLKFIYKNKISEEDKLLLDSLELGLKNLKESYPEHIKIKLQEV